MYSKSSERINYSKDILLSHKIFPYSSDLENELDAPLGIFINPFHSNPYEFFYYLFI